MRKDFYIVTMYIQTEVDGEPYLKSTEKTLVYADNKEHAIRKAYRREFLWLRDNGYRNKEVIKSAKVGFVNEKVNLKAIAEWAKYSGRYPL